MPDATIYDVAEKARVSISTVSRVLNTPDQVSALTRARVIAAIDTLSFVPKVQAVARARKSLGRIGVLAPFFTYPSFVLRLHGIATRLASLSYELVVYNVDSVERRDAYLASLSLTRRLDGLIVLSLPLNDAAARRLVNSELETVLVEWCYPELSSIEIDDVQGGRMAAEYFVQHGHRRCAFVGDTDLPAYILHTSDWRLVGYRQRLHEAGIEFPQEYTALGPHGLESARVQAHKLFDLSDPPTAIFAASDTQAMGVVKAARQRGLTIPDDIAVIGFDDLEMADYIGLTTIRQPLEESGHIAIDLLMSHLNEHSRTTQRIRLPLSLVERATT